MKNSFVTVLIAGLLLWAAPVWAAEADKVGGEALLGIGRLVDIAEQVHRYGNNAPVGVKAYDPAKLEVGQFVGWYDYVGEEEGFVESAWLWPLIYGGENGQLAFVVVEKVPYGGFRLDDDIEDWFLAAELTLTKPVAVVKTQSCIYLYDGSQWQLLDETPFKRRGLAVLDIESPPDTSAIKLRAMCDRNVELVAIADAYLGRLSLEQQAEVEEFRQEMAAIQKQKEEEKRALAAEQAAIDQAAWLQELRARGYMPVYLDGEFQYSVCSVLNGKAMIALNLTSDNRKFESLKQRRLGNSVSLYSEDRDCWLDLHTGQLHNYDDDQVLGQVLVKKSDGIEWVELRKLAELFGMQVRWDKAGGRVLVTSK